MQRLLANLTLWLVLVSFLLGPLVTDPQLAFNGSGSHVAGPLSGNVSAPSGVASSANATVSASEESKSEIRPESTFSVEFHEAGLPTGVTWTVRAGPPSLTETNTTTSRGGFVVFTASPERLYYTVQSPAHYGVVDVSGPDHPTPFYANVSGPTTLTVRFGVNQTVSFQESVSANWPGIPPGSGWGVLLRPPTPNLDLSEGAFSYGGFDLATLNQPTEIASDSANGDLYVLDSGSRSLTEINSTTDRVVGSAYVGNAPDGLAVDPDNGEVYVADTYTEYGEPDFNITVINATTIEPMTTIPTLEDPVAIVADPVDDKVYVAESTFGGGQLVIINGSDDQKLSGVFESSPVLLAVDLSNGDVIVANSNVPYSGTVQIMGPHNNSVLGHLAIRGVPVALSVDPQNNRLFVVARATAEQQFADALYTINLSGNYSSSNISLPSTPTTVRYDPADGDVYVGLESEYRTYGWVSSFNGTSLAGLSTVELAAPPGTIAIDDSNGDEYVLGLGSGLFILSTNTNTILDALPIGAGANSIVIAGQLDRVYLTIPSLDCVEVIPTHLETLAPIEFSIPKGAKYDFYSVHRPNETSQPSKGKLAVHETSITKSIRFKPTIELADFKESGLPAGRRWSVELQGNVSYQKSSTTHQIRFHLQFGVYDFQILGPAGFLSNVTTGSISVSSTSYVQVQVEFTLIPGSHEPSLPTMSGTNVSSAPGAPLQSVQSRSDPEI